MVDPPSNVARALDVDVDSLYTVYAVLNVLKLDPVISFVRVSHSCTVGVEKLKAAIDRRAFQLRAEPVPVRKRHCTRKFQFYCYEPGNSPRHSCFAQKQDDEPREDSISGSKRATCRDFTFVEW